MLDRRRFAILATAWPFIQARSATASDKPPEAIVAELYEAHAKRVEADLTPIWADTSARDAFFTAALVAAFDAAAAKAAANPDEVPPLDGDPLYDAQEFDISDISIAAGEPVDAGVVGVTVTFVNHETPRTLHYKMIGTAAGWRVDDIGYDYGDGGYSLRALLTGE